MTAVMAGLLFRVERLKARADRGILVGILGVVVIIAPWQGLDLSQSLVAQFAILGATACYGFSLAYMRKFVSNSGMSALVFSFLNIGIAAVIMLALTPVVALVAGHARPVDHRQRAAARLPRHRRRLHLEPDHGPRVGTDPRLHRDLHHADRRRRPRRRSSSARQLSWNEPVGALVVFLGILLAQDRLRLRRGRRRQTTKGRMPQHPPLVALIGQSCCSAPCRSSVIVTSLPTSTPPVSSAAFQVRPKSSRLIDRLRGRAGLVVAPRVGAEAAELELERDGLGHAADGEVAVDEEVAVLRRARRSRRTPSSGRFSTSKKSAERRWASRPSSFVSSEVTSTLRLDLGVERVLGGDERRALHAEGAAHLRDHHVADAEGHLAVRGVQHPGARLVAGNVDRGGVGHGHPSCRFIVAVRDKLMTRWNDTAGAIYSRE